MVERVLGVDPGMKRIGLALSDEADGKLALPAATVQRDGNDAAAAAAAVAVLETMQVKVDRLIVGLPLRMNGTEGMAARKARTLGAALGDALRVPVVFWDERLTTVGAERSLRTMGVRAKNQRKVVDQVAAAMILQGWLDARE